MIQNVAFVPREWVLCLVCGSRVRGIEIDSHTARFSLCWPCVQFIERVKADVIQRDKAALAGTESGESFPKSDPPTSTGEGT